MTPMPNIIYVISFVGGIGGLIYLCALVRKLCQ
jgi:hypothetical protein